MAARLGPSRINTRYEGGIMDSNRFDDLARSLAHGTSRRQALKLLGGSLAGGLLAALVSPIPSAAPIGCKANGKKCTV